MAVSLIEVVSSHHERAVARAGNTFIKVETDPVGAANEVRALTTVKAVPVPRLLWHDPGPPAILVIEAAAGQPLAVRGETRDARGDEEWRASGSAMAQLHHSCEPDNDARQRSDDEVAR